MRELPILFSAPMVRAILAGDKTQTRRPVRFEQFHQHGRSGGAIGYSWIELRPTVRGVTCDLHDLLNLCPHGQPGDRLWVREAWAEVQTHGFDAGGSESWGSRLGYRADDMEDGVCLGDPLNRGRWRPSIHMPRWASRITLEVTAVRVERLWEIDACGAIAEGFLQTGDSTTEFSARVRAFHAFSTAWDATYAVKGLGWDVNPWVWVVEFRKLEGKP